MSISQNYYLRRALEIDDVARHLPASKERTGLEDIAEAYRSLASCVTPSSIVMYPADEFDFRAGEFLAPYGAQART